MECNTNNVDHGCLGLETPRSFILPFPHSRTASGRSPSSATEYNAASQALRQHSSIGSDNCSWPSNGPYQQSNQAYQQPQQQQQQPRQFVTPRLHYNDHHQPMDDHASDTAYAYTNPRSSQAHFTRRDSQTQQQYPVHLAAPAHAIAYTTPTRPSSNSSYNTFYNPSQLSYYISPTLSSDLSRGPSSVYDSMGYCNGSNSQNHGRFDDLFYRPVAPPQSQPEKLFKCDQCIKSFSRKHDLKRHKHIHLLLKPFSCNKCRKSFTRKDVLNRHCVGRGCETKASDQPERASSWLDVTSAA